MAMTRAPLRMAPKELSTALLEEYGLCLSPAYIRKVREAANRAGDRVFVAGVAYPRDVFEWLAGHPDFSPFRRPSSRFAAAGRER